ncbi:MAG: replication protein [Defluviitaleaceae bacterium]|nr:replication protein [Defluviitaleaceae bacterium]
MENANKDTQSRKWQITINNPENHGFDHDLIKQIIGKLKSIVYWCMADEIGENGTLHTHLYMAFNSAVRFSTIKKKFPKTHIEMARGTSQENRDYIYKLGKWEKDKKKETHLEDTREEYGEMPLERQGARNDLADLYDMIKQGIPPQRIIDENPQYMMKLSQIEKIRQMILEEKYKNTYRELEVTYIHGITGTGKTRGVMEKYGYENVYRVTNYDHPFDRYNGQDVLLFDEFRNSLKFQEMLEYLDGYPIALKARYADKQASYTKVYIISNYELYQQYTEIQKNKPKDWDAFERRIHKMKEYTSDGVKEYDLVDMRKQYEAIATAV